MCFQSINTRTNIYYSFSLLKQAFFTQNEGPTSIVPHSFFLKQKTMSYTLFFANENKLFFFIPPLLSADFLHVIKPQLSFY